MTAPDDPTNAHDAASEALLRAAHDVLAAEGPAALTVRRIATDAGMSTMNVYSRFGGKNGVVDELFADGFRRLRSSIEQVARTDDPARDLLDCGHAYRRFALANPTYYAIMFQRVIDLEPSPTSQETAMGALMALADRLRRAMDAGQLEQRDPYLTAISVWAVCHGLLSLELGGAAPDGVYWATVFDTTVGVVVDGLRR